MSKNVVVAHYKIESVFKIPIGLDLEDKSVVEWWGVKYDTLYIKYVGIEEEQRIEPVYSATRKYDFKYSDGVGIADALDECVEYDEGYIPPNLGKEDKTQEDYKQ